MTAEEEFDKLDAILKEEQAAMAKLQSNVAETKAASEELTESIDKFPRRFDVHFKLTAQKFYKRLATSRP